MDNSENPLQLKDQKYIRVFSDGNTCTLVFYVNKDNLVSAKANFLINPPDWNTIKEEYEQWVLDIAVEYQDYLFSVYPHIK